MNRTVSGNASSDYVRLFWEEFTRDIGAGPALGQGDCQFQTQEPKREHSEKQDEPVVSESAPDAVEHIVLVEEMSFRFRMPF